MNEMEAQKSQAMDIAELEDIAFRGGQMPELRSQAQCLLFQAFRNLYDYARRVQMSPEQGKREKQEILEAYKVNKFLEDLQESTNQMWKRIELAAAEYAKAPSVEAADKLYEALYQVKHIIRSGEERRCQIEAAS